MIWAKREAFVGEGSRGCPVENQIGPGMGRLQREHSLLDKGTRSADPDARQTWLVFGEQQEALGMEKTVVSGYSSGRLSVCQVWWYLILSVYVLLDKKSMFQGVNSAFL